MDKRLDLKSFLEEDAILKASEVSDGEVFEFVDFHAFVESFGRQQLDTTVLVNGTKRRFFLSRQQVRQLIKIFGSPTLEGLIGKSVTTKKRQLEIVDRMSGKPLKVEVLDFVSLVERPGPRKWGGHVV